MDETDGEVTDDLPPDTAQAKYFLVTKNSPKVRNSVVTSQNSGISGSTGSKVDQPGNAEGVTNHQSAGQSAMCVLLFTPLTSNPG